jgi:hypothetical protein
MNFEEDKMAHPYHHALSSAKKWGGTAEDFLHLHSWFDESKMISADFGTEHFAITPKEFSWRRDSLAR